MNVFRKFDRFVFSHEIRVVGVIYALREILGTATILRHEQTEKIARQKYRVRPATARLPVPEEAGQAIRCRTSDRESKTVHFRPFQPF
jgi:hypothetical protein